MLRRLLPESSAAAAAATLHRFRLSRSQNLLPTRFLLPSVLSACGAARAGPLGVQVHALALRLGLDASPFVHSALVSMYSRCSDFPAAVLLLSSAAAHDSASWNALIVSCSRAGLFADALKVFEEMRRRGLLLDEFTFPSVLNSAAFSSHIDTGRVLHSLILKSGFVDLLHLSNALLDMYAKCGDVVSARKLFDEMPQRDVVTWTSLITSSARHVSHDAALQLFLEMSADGVDLDEFVISGVLSSCAELTLLELGRQLHATSAKRGFDAFLSVGNAILSMYFKTGCVDEGGNVFKSMKSRDEVTWTALIVGFAQNGRGRESVQVYDEMIRTGFKPDCVTFIGLLFACSHAGLVEAGRAYFDSMERVHRIVPGPEHYACMIDLLARSGRIVEAVQVLDRVRFEPDATVWKAVLAACGVHWKKELAVGLAEHAAGILFQMAPKDPVAYVLLANIYCRIGRWVDVARIRSLMKARGVNKEPGCSWIEVGGVVHVFHVEDREHDRTAEIYGKVEEMIGRIREAGYVAEKGSELHDIERKELGLAFHSEKLAVAFGLVGLARGAAIRVYKNLRVCGDCHSALKVVSRVYGRIIVLRDSNCFHHMREGVCSCGDYW